MQDLDVEMELKEKYYMEAVEGNFTRRHHESCERFTWQRSVSPCEAPSMAATSKASASGIASLTESMLLHLQACLVFLLYTSL